jgi:hypothetical protein
LLQSWRGKLPAPVWETMTLAPALLSGYFLCEAALAWGWITLRILPNEAESRIHFGREGNFVLKYFFLRKALPFDPRALSPSRTASQSQ